MVVFVKICALQILIMIKIKWLTIYEFPKMY